MKTSETQAQDAWRCIPCRLPKERWPNNTALSHHPFDDLHISCRHIFYRRAVLHVTGMDPRNVRAYAAGTTRYCHLDPQDVEPS